MKRADVDRDAGPRTPGLDLAHPSRNAIDASFVTNLRRKRKEVEVLRSYVEKAQVRTAIHQREVAASNEVAAKREQELIERPLTPLVEASHTSKESLEWIRKRLAPRSDANKCIDELGHVFRAPEGMKRTWTVAHSLVTAESHKALPLLCACVPTHPPTHTPGTEMELCSPVGIWRARRAVLHAFRSRSKDARAPTCRDRCGGKGAGAVHVHNNIYGLGVMEWKHGVQTEVHKYFLRLRSLRPKGHADPEAQESLTHLHASIGVADRDRFYATARRRHYESGGDAYRLRRLKQFTRIHVDSSVVAQSLAAGAATNSNSEDGVRALLRGHARVTKDLAARNARAKVYVDEFTRVASAMVCCGPGHRMNSTCRECGLMQSVKGTFIMSRVLTGGKPKMSGVGELQASLEAEITKRMVAIGALESELAALNTCIAEPCAVCIQRVWRLHRNVLVLIPKDRRVVASARALKARRIEALVRDIRGRRFGGDDRAEACIRRYSDIALEYYQWYRLERWRQQRVARLGILKFISEVWVPYAAKTAGNRKRAKEREEKERALMAAVSAKKEAEERELALKTMRAYYKKRAREYEDGLKFKCDRPRCGKVFTDVKRYQKHIAAHMEEEKRQREATRLKNEAAEERARKEKAFLEALRDKREENERIEIRRQDAQRTLMLKYATHNAKSLKRYVRNRDEHLRGLRGGESPADSPSRWRARGRRRERGHNSGSHGSPGAEPFSHHDDSGDVAAVDDIAKRLPLLETSTQRSSTHTRRRLPGLGLGAGTGSDGASEEVGDVVARVGGAVADLSADERYDSLMDSLYDKLHSTTSMSIELYGSMEGFSFAGGRSSNGGGQQRQAEGHRRGGTETMTDTIERVRRKYERIKRRAAAMARSGVELSSSETDVIVHLSETDPTAAGALFGDGDGRGEEGDSRDHEMKKCLKLPLPVAPARMPWLELKQASDLSYNHLQKHIPIMKTIVRVGVNEHCEASLKQAMNQLKADVRRGLVDPELVGLFGDVHAVLHTSASMGGVSIVCFENVGAPSPVWILNERGLCRAPTQHQEGARRRGRMKDGDKLVIGQDQRKDAALAAYQLIYELHVPGAG